MNEKKIIIGEINNESFHGTPIDIFKWAILLSKQDVFIVYTNNPQLVEALEVLCGEDNVDVYLKLHFKYTKLSFWEAYNYLGDVYDFIDYIRGMRYVGGKITDNDLYKQINEYNEKYLEICNREDVGEK